MELFNKQESIRSIAQRWRAQYPSSKDDIYIKLQALDTTTATTEDIAAIIGNSAWVATPECDECGTATWSVVELGQPPAYDSHTACICAACLRKALNLLEANAT